MKDDIRKQKMVIEKLEKNIASKKVLLKDLQEKLMKDCVHPHDKIFEIEYKEDDGMYFDNGEPPFRVCSICGYAEEGWGCGYKILDVDYNIKLTQIPRIKGYSMIRKYVEQ